MKKRSIALILVIVLVVSLLSACGGTKKGSDGLSLTVAGLSGGMQTFPVYVAQQKGWFDEEKVAIEIIYFENGPVQMEALASKSWDVACTGIGGVLTGVIGHDAVYIGAPHSDDGR